IAGEGPAAIELPSPRAVDPDEIEPGLVIFERFCVVGNVWREPRGWRVRVTDLGRELGQPPHHRLDLHVLDTERSDPVALRVAIGLHSGEDRRVLAIGEGEDLVAMVTPPAEGRPPDRDDDARVASVLVSLLADGHARGVTGWRFDPVDLRVEGHRVRFDAWRHLDGVHFGDEPAARADVIALVGVLRALGHAVRAPTDGSLTAESLQTLITGEEPSPRRGGNEADLERVRAAVDASRSRGPGRLLLLGPDRLRFLDDLHHDLVSRGCVVVMVRVAGQMPCTSLCLLAEAVDRALVQVGPTRRAALTARLEEEPPAVQQVQRRSDHHARVLARVIAELGTLDRPAVVLVDDLREADDGLLAVLAQTPRGPHPVTWVLGTSGEVPLDAERIELAPASSPRQDRPLLSPLARRVALLRAIRPEHVSVSWLGEVTGEERAAVLDATRELIEAELVDEVTGGGLQWTDDRARDVVLASADPVELAAAHRGVATWLDGVDADSALVEWAWHSEHAAPGGVDSDLASRHLLAGTRLLEQGDVTRAAWHLGRARDRATPQDDAILACAHEGLAEVAVSLGDGAEAKRCWMAAVEAVDDPPQ
ncbi:MAG: ATP-binding protein, partial [Alphaproteobacteria bacterium]|nr:ATP-binding protein [Alphaproteobacteria bacterium]